MERDPKNLHWVLAGMDARQWLARLMIEVAYLDERRPLPVLQIHPTIEARLRRT